MAECRTAGWQSIDACTGRGCSARLQPLLSQPPSPPALPASVASPIVQADPVAAQVAHRVAAAALPAASPIPWLALAPSTPRSSQCVARCCHLRLAVSYCGDRCCTPCSQLQLVQRLRQQAASLHCCCLRPCGVTTYSAAVAATTAWPIIFFILWLLLPQALQLAPACTAAPAAPPAAGGCAGWSPAAPCWRLCCCPSARLP